MKIIFFFILFCSSISAYPRELSPSRARQIRTDTTNFDNILSSSDDRVQDALDTLDDGNFTGNMTIGENFCFTSGVNTACFSLSGDTLTLRVNDETRQTWQTVLAQRNIVSPIGNRILTPAGNILQAP